MNADVIKEAHVHHINCITWNNAIYQWQVHWYIFIINVIILLVSSLCRVNCEGEQCLFETQLDSQVRQFSLDLIRRPY